MLARKRTDSLQRNNISLIYILCYLSVFTVSFDIFLVIHVGFNFRVTQLALLPVMAYVLISRLTSETLIIPLGFESLLIWAFFIIIFIPNTFYITRSAGYAFWLIFSVATIFVMVQLFRTKDRLIQLIRIYIYSFALVALFGLVQFILPLLHLGAPLVMQWWFPGLLPRINGFSYEPSFFSTYMLIGWVFIACLLRDRTEIIGHKLQLITFTLITLVMILSSSRMGWLMMVLWYIQYPFLFIWRLCKGRLNKRFFKYSSALVICCYLLLYIIIYCIGFETISFLLSGLGIGGASSHSSDTRTREFFDTLQIFLKSPFIGYSLGGISSAIGELRGIDVSSLEIAKENEGMSVFAEVLAASGVVGFIPFFIYIFRIIKQPLSIAKHLKNITISNLLRALVTSLVFELIILQFNQTILRPYLWMHIAILSCVFSVAKSQYRRQATYEHFL